MPFFFYNISGAVDVGATWLFISIDLIWNREHQFRNFPQSAKPKSNIWVLIPFSQNIEEYSISESSFTFSTLFDLSQIRLCGEDHLSIPIYTSCGRGRTIKKVKKRGKSKNNTKKLKYNEEMWKGQKFCLIFECEEWKMNSEI